MAKERFIEAGRITNTHGIAGEVKIEVWVNSPEFLKKCGRIYVDGKEYRFIGCKLQERFLIAALEGIGDVNAAMPLKGKTAMIDREDAPLGKNGYFLQDLIGAEVFEENGESIGVLEELYDSPAAVIYVVRGEKEHLIPGIPEFIKEADPDAGRITVHLIEGM